MAIAAGDEGAVGGLIRRRTTVAAPNGARPTAAVGTTRARWSAPSARIGWDVVPEQALALLVGAGLCPREPVASWAAESGVRDRGAAGYSQDVEGWWVDATAMISVQARRPLVRESTTGRRFRPTGAPWTVTAIVTTVTAADTTTQRWSRAAPGAGAPAAQPTRFAALVWEILPGAVQARLGTPTQYGACREHLDSGGSRSRWWPTAATAPGCW